MIEPRCLVAGLVLALSAAPASADVYIFGQTTPYATLQAASDADAQHVTVTVEGDPGDRVWILRGRAPVFQPTLGPLGIVLVPKPWLLPILPMGVVPASGTLDLTLWVPDLPGTILPGVITYAQALVVGAGGEVRLSGPLHVLVRNT